MKIIKVDDCVSCPNYNHDTFDCSELNRAVIGGQIEPDCPLPDHFLDAMKKVEMNNDPCDGCIYELGTELCGDCIRSENYPTLRDYYTTAKQQP